MENSGFMLFFYSPKNSIKTTFEKFFLIFLPSVENQCNTCVVKQKKRPNHVNWDAFNTQMKPELRYTFRLG